MTFRQQLPRHQRAGFSLIELCVVIIIVGVIASVALPQLLPLLIFSELDGEARRLANYGAGAIAEAALFGTDITVHFDLAEQEYYATRLVFPEAEEEAEAMDHLGMFSSFRSSSDLSPAELSDMLAARAQGDQRLSSDLPAGFDPAEADAQMHDRFSTRFYQLLYKRAENVKHDTGFLSEIGPLFEREFTLSWSEPYEEELTDPILRRYRLPAGVQLADVRVEGSSNTRGTVEIDVSPLGLNYEVLLYLRNDDGDYFTVVWHPLTGRGMAREGRWE